MTDFETILEACKVDFVKSARQRAALTWPAVSCADAATGVGPLPVLPGLSRALGATFKAKPRKCWRNAFTALLYSRGLDVLYVEGYAVRQDGPRQPMAHGWLEWAGRVIDPTWPEDVLTTAYIPAVRYTLASALAALLSDCTGDTKAGSETVLPLVERGYTRGGLDHMAYSRALIEAGEVARPGHAAYMAALCAGDRLARQGWAAWIEGQQVRGVA